MRKALVSISGLIPISFIRLIVNTIEEWVVQPASPAARSVDWFFIGEDGVPIEEPASCTSILSMQNTSAQAEAGS